MDELKLIHEKLLEIWKDTLDIQNLSPDDDFFRCGGNSLTAIELLVKIQRAFHRNFRPDMIYRNPTIRNQALLITGKAGNTVEYHPLINPIREEGLLPPLFCVHPLGTWMNQFAHLSPSIDKKRPVFGVRTRGLEPTETLPLTVEDAVKEQIEAIKSVQKEGPYNLMGYSAGGIIAYELACQLSERGEQVAFLGIIDLSAPVPEVRFFKRITKNLFPGRVLRRIPAFVYSRLKANPESKLNLIISKSVRLVFHHLFYRSGSKSLPTAIYNVRFNTNRKEHSLVGISEERQSPMKTQHKASFTYRPRTFPGHIILFSTGPDPVFFPGDVMRGWRDLGKTVVIDVPGDHATLFHDPNIGILAKKINEQLVLADEHI